MGKRIVASERYALTSKRLLVILLLPVLWCSGVGIDGNNPANQFPNQPQLINSNPNNQYQQTSFSQQTLLNNPSQLPQIMGTDNQGQGLVMGPPPSGFQLMPPAQQPDINHYDEWSQNPFSEDEIRVRSHELLESDDMQQLLRLFSMGGGANASMNMPDDGFSYPTFMPTPSTDDFSNRSGLEEDRTRPGKAVVGWLKIKAAMRWGFFVRKKAAERRAQLVELDDWDFQAWLFLSIIGM